MTSIYWAARFNDRIAPLLNQIDRANVNYQDYSTGLTALHWASKYGNVETIKILLDFGASAEVRSKRGWSPFHLAVRYCSASVISTFVEKGISLNFQAKCGCSAIHFALTDGRHEEVKYLLENGASINIRNADGQRPLHLAAGHPCSTSLRLLVEAGALIDATDNFGQTALYIAVKKGSSCNIEFLLMRGASVEEKTDDGDTAYRQFRRLLDEHKHIDGGPYDMTQNFRKTGHIFGKYILKLKYLFPIDENVEDVELEDFEVASCMAEVEAIKSTQVIEGFSLYEVVTSCKTPFYLLDLEIVRALRTLFRSPDYSVRFPNYGLVLKNKFRASQHSRYYHTLQAIYSVFTENRKRCIKVPEEIWRIIFALLSDDDVVNFAISGTDRDFICKSGKIWKTPRAPAVTSFSAPPLPSLSAPASLFDDISSCIRAAILLP